MSTRITKKQQHLKKKKSTCNFSNHTTDI